MVGRRRTFPRGCGGRLRGEEDRQGVARPDVLSCLGGQQVVDQQTPRLAVGSSEANSSEQLEVTGGPGPKHSRERLEELSLDPALDACRAFGDREELLKQR